MPRCGSAAACGGRRTLAENMIVSLVGFSGIGKSLLSRRLEEELGWQRVCCDEIIEGHVAPDRAFVSQQPGPCRSAEDQRRLFQRLARNSPGPQGRPAELVALLDDDDPLAQFGSLNRSALTAGSAAYHYKVIMFCHWL